MKIYFNNLGIETSRVLDDVWVKNDVGRRLEVYIDGVDVSAASISLKLIIGWSNGETTNALLMNKFIDGSGAYIVLPQLIVDGTTELTVRVTDSGEDMLTNTPQFTREILASVDAADDTNITPAEYAAMQEAINENATNIILSLQAAKEYSDEQLNSKWRTLNVNDVSDEDEILELYSDLSIEYEQTGQAIKFNFVGEDTEENKYLGNVNAYFGEVGDDMQITFFKDGNVYYYFLHDNGEEIVVKNVMFEARDTTTTLTNEDKLITSAAVKAVTDLCASTTYVNGQINLLQGQINTLSGKLENRWKELNIADCSDPNTIIMVYEELHEQWENEGEELYFNFTGKLDNEPSGSYFGVVSTNFGSANSMHIAFFTVQETYYYYVHDNGEEIQVESKGINSLISGILDGTNAVGKAKKDQNGNTIDTTYGHSIEATINTSTYVLTLKLKDAHGTALNTQTLDLPLESVVVSGSYDAENQELILTLQSGQTIEIPVSDLISGLQTEITNDNKLASDLVDDTNQTNKFVTASEKAQIATNTNDITTIIIELGKKANVEDLENGQLVVSKSLQAKTLEPKTENAGVIQEVPFICQGTATANNTTATATSPVAKHLEKQGNTVVVNQQVQNGTFEDSTGWGANLGTIGVADNKCTYTITEQNTGNYINTTIDVKSGHQYYLEMTVTASKATRCGFYLGGALEEGSKYDILANTKTIVRCVMVAGGNDNNLFLYCNRTSGLDINDTCVYEKVNAVDLTQWGFDSDTIAYLEAHPEAFINYYNGSLAYNEGEIVDSDGQYLVTLGFNQLNPDTSNNDQFIGNYYIQTALHDYVREANNEFNCYRIRVIPNTNYCISKTKNETLGSVAIVRFVDKDYNLIDGNENGYVATQKYVVTTPNNCVYMEISVSKYADYFVCLNLSWDAARNGEYEPFVKHVYNTGTEVLRSAGSVKDIKSANGTTTRYVKQKEYASEDITLAYEYSNVVYYAIPKPSDYVGYNSYLNAVGTILCDKYNIISALDDWNSANGIGTINGQASDSNFWIGFAVGTTLAQAQAAIDGLHLNYVLATPTTEHRTLFSDLFEVEDYSIMYWLDTNDNFVVIPQGCKIFYQADYVGLIDDLGNYTEYDVTKLAKKTDLTSLVNTKINDIEQGRIVAGEAIEAESIKTALGVLDNTPFSCQPSGGDADITSGYQKLNKLVGVKVVDNQGINKSTIAFVNATTNISGEQITITASTASGGNIYSTTGVRTREANHKYLVLAKASHQWAIQTGTSEYKTFDAGVVSTIITQTQRNPNLFPLWGTVAIGDTQVFDYLYVIDLALRYGNNDVVNAIIGNDSTKYVERLVKFDSNVLKNIAYNTGSFSKCKSAKLKSNKFNQWNEEWEVGSISLSTGRNTSASNRIRSKNFIKVVPNTTYYYKSSYGDYILFYDTNENYLGDYVNIVNTTFTIPSNCGLIKFYTSASYGGTYNHNICINFSYDGSRDGEYEASDIMYVDLPNQDLNGILKVDGDGNVYADGDELYPNGVGNSKRFSDEEDLSTKTWSTTDGTHYTQLTNMTTSGARALCTNYVYFSYNSIGSLSNLPRGGFTISSNYIYINSGGSNPTGTIFYKLATPQELSAPTFDANIYQDDFGLTTVLDEDDNELNGLQGFEIFYKANIAAFTEMVYNKTGGDSDNLALKSEVTEEATTRVSKDNILQNAIGGTLRQCLCVKASLDFENTNFVDLESLNWSYNDTTNFKCWISNDLTSLAKFPADNNTIGKIISTNYVVLTGTDFLDGEIIGLAASNLTAVTKSIFVRNGSSTTKPSGLLAYEKASE